MKNRGLLSIVLAVTLLLLPEAGSAQSATKNQFVGVTGKVMTQWAFNPADIMNLSQYNTDYTTARVAAMGGAFTSLGGDIATMHINPAGLGMYRGSEFSITPSLSINKYSNKLPEGADGWADNITRTGLGLSNIGAAFNIYQGSGPLTSFTLGVSYNKIADYNSRSAVHMTDSGSIGDIFARQLQGIDSDLLAKNAPWSNTDIPLSLWPAIAAYKSFFVDAYNSESDDEFFRKNYYTPGLIGENLMIDHYADLTTKGSAGEFAISGGLNFGNKLYVGATIGIVSLSYKETLDYYEFYIDNVDPAGGEAGGAQTENYLYQYRKISATGVNFKLGIIYNPLPGLRLGAAVHTPTYTNATMDYSAYNESIFKKDDWGYGESPENRWNHDFNTPTRLMVGASYTFGNKGLLSVDYERAWYNGLRYTSGTRLENNSFRNDFKNLLQPQNIFRVGGEFRATDIVSLRAGYTQSGELTSAAFRENTLGGVMGEASFSSPVTYKSYSITAGVGFRLGRYSSLDLSYAYMNSKQTMYDLYYANIPEVYPPSATEPTMFETLTGRLKPEITRHVVSLSLSVRF